MNEESLFAEALKHEPGSDRAAYLAAACGDDSALRERLENLLVADERASGLLDRPRANDPTTDSGSTNDFPGVPVAVGSVIAGRYRLLELIGEGGMGDVFVAEQTHPVRRKVALKLIKSGLDSRSVLARFERERQALAVMDHPNIAKVFDGGVTEGGRPYFVMEYIRGVPITEYCDQVRLPIRQRLELFSAACQAVQHAHQKGIIHRDLKPSNILVALYDGQPVTKVIDFGLAKVVGQPLTDKTVHTGHAVVMGTPLYMSPEQATLNNLDIDTRSDIYSLGVVLYELLTGSTPIDRERFRKAAWDETLRLVREEDPPVPSTRLSSAEGLPSVAALRQIEPAKLSRLVQGELDWIVMKALDKDRFRRYDSASAFASDLQRYLDDEPVLASPPSAVYRFKKFARRNKVMLTTAAAIGLVLISASIVSTVLAAWAVNAQWLANERLIQEEKALEESQASERRAIAAAEAEKKATIAEKEAKVIAQDRDAEAEAVLEFFQNKVLAAAGPEGLNGGLGSEVSLRKAIESALPFVATDFSERPLIEARLRVTLGALFFHLGDPKIAAEQFERARMLFTRHAGPKHFNVLRSMHNLANCYVVLGRLNDALKLREEALAQFEAQYGIDDPETLRSMYHLAHLYNELGRTNDALALFEKTRALMKSNLAADDEELLRCMQNLAIVYADAGRYADALKLIDETMSLISAKLGPEHLETLAMTSTLADIYSGLGRESEALELHKKVLALTTAKLGPDHPHLLDSMGNVGKSYVNLQRAAEGLPMLEQYLARRKAAFGPDHPRTLSGMANLASALSQLGRHDEALSLREETLARRKATLPPDHPSTVNSMHNLALSYFVLKRYDDALKLHEETLTLRKNLLGPDHPHTLASMSFVADCLGAVGRHADALKLQESTLTLRKAKLGPDHHESLQSAMSVAILFNKLCRHAEALELLEKTLDIQRAKLGPDHPDALLTMSFLVDAYYGLGRVAEGLQLHEKTLAFQKAKLGEDNAYTLSTWETLALKYGAVGRHADALQLFEELLTIEKAKFGPNHSHVLGTILNIAVTYGALGRHAEALEHHQSALSQRKAQLGADHPDTLRSMSDVAKSLMKLNRGTDALPIIDDCISRAEGKIVDWRLLAGVIALRLRHFEKIKDPTGCLETVSKWEALQRADAVVLYNSACYRGVCAAVIRESDKSPAGEVKAKEQADLAMAWLKQAIMAGFKDTANLQKDKDLDVLRDREDFKKLLAELTDGANAAKP